METRSIRLLDNNEHVATALDRLELELSPTEYQQPNINDINNPQRNSASAYNLFGATKGRLSEEIMRAVQSHHIRMARNEHRTKSFFSVALYTLALSLCMIPVGLFALEMIPERCKICLESVELDTYFVASALCGGFGAILLFGDDFWEYCLAKFTGGAVSSLGALFTVWMMLQSIPSGSIMVAVLVFFFAGILGALPGVVVYLLFKIISDECWVSDLRDFEDDFASLTKLVTAEL